MKCLRHEKTDRYVRSRPRRTGGCCAPGRARQVVDRYLAALSRADLDAVLELVEPEGRQVDLSASGECPARADRRRRLEALCLAYERLDFRRVESWQTGSRIAFRWRARGTTRDGEAVELRGLDMFELSARGRVKRHWLDLSPERYFPSGLTRRAECGPKPGCTLPRSAGGARSAPPAASDAGCGH